MPTVLRPYESGTDEAWGLALWEACLGDRWPVPAEVFRSQTAGGAHLVAEIDGRPLGLVATQRDGERGSILAVLVAPPHRRRGIGRALLQAAMERLRADGASHVQLGGGAWSYFWCGVPADLPGAWPFFAACGWSADATHFDLVGDLATCATPAWVWDRVRSAGVTVRRALPSDLDAVLAFERRHFPRWAPHYEARVGGGDGADIVVALDAGGDVVGTSGILSPRSAAWRARFPWPRVLGERTGGVAALGVAEAQRGRGIGLALAAFVTEQLAEEGLSYSYVGWTVLVDWYGRLGYRVWQEYVISRREV